MWMNEEVHEQQFTCPYCWQPVTMLLDTSLRRQSYIEDCEVCCNPFEIEYETDYNGDLIRFEAQAMDR